MNTPTRSAGPWSAEPGPIGWRIQSGPVVIGAVADMRPEAQGNALAFAGADDLIVAAKAVLAWWEKFSPTTSYEQKLQVLDAEWGEFFKLRKAVASATGTELFPVPSAPILSPTATEAARQFSAGLDPLALEQPSEVL